MVKNEILPNIQELPVMESFYSIQGEGFHQGKAAYFIRLGGCDVGCTWCDVKESWDPANHPILSVSEIVEKALGAGGASIPWAISELVPNSVSEGRIVVVTGGEPLMHDCTTLTGQLRRSGFNTHIETSGAYPLSGSWDWICLSPKKFKAPLPEILPRADELKIVIFNQSDFQWAEQYASLVSSTCRLFLQPEWDRSARVTPLIVDYIKNNPRWSFSLQLHKYIRVP
jgi:7-carboxy-7-deazaguanine synthase